MSGCLRVVIKKRRFRDFIKKYQTGRTVSNTAGNFNPENNFVYNDNDKDVQFTVFGEIYIRTQDGRIMRIKSVLRPEGSPEPDYDNEKPAGSNDKYFFSTSEGNLYFNNTLNKEITDNKKLSKRFTVVDKYEFFLSPDEVKIEGHAIKNIGVVRINSSDYPLFYSFIADSGPPPPRGLPPNNDYSTIKPTSGSYYYVECDGMVYYFSPKINQDIEDGVKAGQFNHAKFVRFEFGTTETFFYYQSVTSNPTVTMFGKKLLLHP